VRGGVAAISRDAGGRAPPAGVLVVGVGNVLLGDEGFGVHVVRDLARDTAPRDDVAWLDAGTALLDCAGELARHRHVILVDAIRAGAPPGTIHRIADAMRLADEPAARSLSLHGWGVAETLGAVRRLGLVPPAIELIGAEPDRIEPGMELSPPLAEAAERVVAILREELGLAPA